MDSNVFLLCAAGVLGLLAIGFYALLTTRNLLRTLIALEVLMKGVTLAIVAAGYFTGEVGLGQAMAITMIIIEVAVMVVGIGIVLSVHRRTGSLDTAKLTDLKG